jgi:putative membrane protein
MDRFPNGPGYPGFPGRPGVPGGRPGELVRPMFFDHHPPTWEAVLHTILPFVVLLAIVALVVWAVLRITGDRGGFAPRSAGWTGQPAWAAAGGPRGAFDPALEELRLRYARGEVDRDEFVRRSADLGAPPPPPYTTPSQPPVPADEPPPAAPEPPEAPPA